MAFMKIKKKGGGITYQYWCVWRAMQIEKKVLLQAQAILYLAPEMNYFDQDGK